MRADAVTTLWASFWQLGAGKPCVGSVQSVWYSCFSLWLYLHALLKPHQRYCRWKGQSISPADHARVLAQRSKILNHTLF